jgi:shikimate dehydrogenase
MKKYGLLGKSLSHSFSKNFFTKYFAENKINAAYSNFEIAQIQEVKSILESGVHGLNVTIPFKEAIIPFLDEITDDAKQIITQKANRIILKQKKNLKDQSLDLKK